MFVKILPYYQLCTSWYGCHGIEPSSPTSVGHHGAEDGYRQRCDNNNHVVVVQNGHHLKEAPATARNGRVPSGTGPAKNPSANVFRKVFQAQPDLVRICCCWRFVRRRRNNASPTSSTRSRPSTQDQDTSDGLTNVVPLDGGTIYTPMKHFIGREVDDGCHVIELEDTTTSELVRNHQGHSPRTDERLTNCSTAASPASTAELHLLRTGNEEK